MGEWISVKERPPDKGVVVQTKIDDVYGVRNQQPLKKKGLLWLFPDGSMYVYYTPTHWLPEPPKEEN